MHSWVTTKFRTKETEKYRELDLLCLYDNPGVFLHKEFYNLEGNRGFDTGVSSNQYACGIVGMAGLNGDIQENDDGDILQAYTYIGSNDNWHLLADFRSHKVHEMWNIDLLCVDRSAAELVGDWSEGWVR